MKKLSLVAFFIFFCVINAKETSAFSEGTTFWYKHASHAELVRHYSKMGLDEMCSMWWEVGHWKKKRRVPNRNAIKEVLRNQGEDQYICMKLQNIQ